MRFMYFEFLQNYFNKIIYPKTDVDFIVKQKQQNINIKYIYTLYAEQF